MEQVNPIYYKVSIATPDKTYSMEIRVIGENVYAAFLYGWGELNKRYPELIDVNDMAIVSLTQSGTKTPQQLPVYTLDAAMEQQNA
jgi:hypothetical protein